MGAKVREKKKKGGAEMGGAKLSPQGRKRKVERERKGGWSR